MTSRSQLRPGGVVGPDILTSWGALACAQAGSVCVCRSAAWSAKIVTSAWWVSDPRALSVRLSSLRRIS
jgi:hypothetical protein